jgi:hypothetical protein
MASYNYTFTSGDTVTPTKLNSARTVSEIVNADIKSDAAIAATKLASDSITNTQIKSDAAIAGTKVNPNFGTQNIVTTGTLTTNAGCVIGGNSSSAALRVAQTGSGNAFVVEDSDNPDATPFIIDASGNVGIGATVAGNKLSVRDGDVALVAGANAADAGQTVRFFANAIDDAANNYAGIKGGLISASTPQQGYLAFSTSGSERARITSGGNVGIAKTNPATALDVNGTVTAVAFAGGTISAAAGSVVSGSSSDAALRIEQNGAGYALLVEDSTTPDATPFIIDAAGNVGIGAITAGNKLSVRDGDVALVSGANSGDSGHAVKFFANGADDSSNNYAQIKGGLISASTPQQGYLRFDTSGSERMRIAQDGNIGVAKTNPSTALDVSGTVTATSFSGNGIVPVGAIMPFASATAPAGWLIANGDAVPNGSGTVQSVTADFSALYAVVSTSFGSAGTLPDLRGIFVRGSGDQTISGAAYSKAFALKETDAFKAHNHAVTDPGHSHYSQSGLSGSNIASGYRAVGINTNSLGAGPATQTGVSIQNAGGDETRPANIAMLYCIKF